MLALRRKDETILETTEMRMLTHNGTEKRQHFETFWSGKHHIKSETSLVALVWTHSADR